MSLWIQVDENRASNRKTDVLAELLARGAADLFGSRDETAWRAIAIALLDGLWGYAANHHPDGELTDAHPATLRRTLTEWLTGTEWARKDPRDLFINSGHVDRRRDGRIFIHDWMEWTGGSVMKLAKDRKRKRLARNKGVRRRPRKAARTVHGQSKPGPALAVQCSAVQSSPIQDSKQQQPPPPKLDYVTRCCVAVNVVLERKLAGAFAPLVPNVERPTATAWEAAGIPIELAEATLIELAGRFPNVRGRQPQSLGYFTAALHEAFAKQREGMSPRLGPRTRVTAPVDNPFREATLDE